MNPDEIYAQLKALRGMVATVCTTGTVEPSFSEHMTEMRAHAERSGFHSVEWRIVEAKLVESGRDEACAHALSEGYEWIMQIDADAAPFPPNALQVLLQNAYVDIPSASAVGAYANLKQPPYLPTIDTGTGTWEERYPGEGILRVIRTGGHFLLTKTSALRMFGPPWFRTRVAPTALRAMAEVDGYARQHFDGRNPLASVPEWNELRTHASNVPAQAHSVGEDSGFCDALTAAGGEIYVNTDLVVGHVGKRVISAQDLRGAVMERRRLFSLACGVEV